MAPWAKGQVLMPLDSYGFSPKFGWVNDRFGVSWQLTLAQAGQTGAHR
jgi:predicted 3-demethylubiquinone-9 3-methyltransferase (glyoxalase superfamily)